MVTQWYGCCAMCYPAAQRDSAAELLTAGVHRELLQSDMRAFSPERDDSVACEQSNGFDVTISRYQIYHTRY